VIGITGATGVIGVSGATGATGPASATKYGDILAIHYGAAMP
jgi:hypothetical protein